MSYWAELVSLCAIGSMLALSTYLPLSAGAVVLCMGSAMSIGAVVAGSVAQGSDNALAVFLSLAAGGAAGFVAMTVVGLCTMGLKGFHFSLATLAVAELARVLAETQPALGGAVGYRLAAANLDLAWPLGCTATALALVLLFDRSLLRKAIALGAQSPVRASAVGIDLMLLRVGLLAAGGLIAGLAGGLFIYEVGLLDPRWWGFEAGLQIAAFAILGGTRSGVGPAIAGVALTLAPELLRFSSDQRMLLFGLVLVVAMVLRPDGAWITARRVQIPK